MSGKHNAKDAVEAEKTEKVTSLRTWKETKDTFQKVCDVSNSESQAGARPEDDV
jgi:hypothetical protein